MSNEQDNNQDFEKFAKEAEKKAQKEKDWLAKKEKEREESDERIQHLNSKVSSNQPDFGFNKKDFVGIKNKELKKKILTDLEKHPEFFKNPEYLSDLHKKIIIEANEGKLNLQEAKALSEKIDSKYLETPQNKLKEGEKQPENKKEKKSGSSDKEQGNRKSSSTTGSSFWKEFIFDNDDFDVLEKLKDKDFTKEIRENLKKHPELFINPDYLKRVAYERIKKEVDAENFAEDFKTKVLEKLLEEKHKIFGKTEFLKEFYKKAQEENERKKKPLADPVEEAKKEKKFKEDWEDKGKTALLEALTDKDDVEYDDNIEDLKEIYDEVEKEFIAKRIPPEKVEALLAKLNNRYIEVQIRLEEEKPKEVAEEATKQTGTGKEPLSNEEKRKLYEQEKIILARTLKKLREKEDEYILLTKNRDYGEKDASDEETRACNRVAKEIKALNDSMERSLKASAIIEKDLSEGDIKKIKESLKLKGIEDIPGGLEGLFPQAEKTPDPEDGIEELMKWFQGKIHALVQEYPDQSFETNWTLIWPLQQMIAKLWPKEGIHRLRDIEGEFIITNREGNPLTWKDKKGKEHAWTYSKLREGLAAELEAFRNIHNFRYLYKNAIGVESVITASSLLDNKYVEHLFHIPEVAESLRHFIKLGREYAGIRLVDSGGGTRMKEDMEKLQGKSWHDRVAGALYSALGESWKHDIVLNGSGDFFCGRVTNIPVWAERYWMVYGERKPFRALWQALDLRIDNFFDKVFGDGKPRSGGLSAKELADLGIECYKDKHGKRRYNMENARFEDINLNFTALKNPKMRTDSVRDMVLDCDDGDKIRKIELGPDGLISKPDLRHFKAMEPFFKHLKGKERSDWVKDVARYLILYHKDRIAPTIEWSWWPEIFRDNRAREMNSAAVGWTNLDIIRAVDSLVPLLTNKDREELLTELVGSKPKRGFISFTRSALLIGFGAAFGAIKGSFSALGKYLFSEK